jgi:hypothetical protein
VAVSCFADWKKPEAVSMMLFRIDGRLIFTVQVVALARTPLITCAVAVPEGKSSPVLVTGGFHGFPPWDRVSRITLWEPTH